MNLLVIFILITSELFLILTHLGVFCIWPIALVFILVALIAWKIEPSPFFLFFKGTVPFSILPILAIAGFLFFQPYQYMDGGWDPGNYINTGVHIAKTGSTTYYDDTVKGVEKGIKYPGLNIKDGLVFPQFFHLYPVWIAIFYKLFGLKSVFYVNPFFALLNIILLFLIGEKVRKGCGILACLLLALNVPQIWNARFPMPEILAQFFLLSGFYFWFDYLGGNNKSSAFWAGVSFGEFILTVITSLLIIPLIIFYLIYRYKKRDIYFIIPFLFLLIHLGAQLATYSSVYLESVIMFFQKKEVYLGILLFIIFLVMCKINIRLIAFVVPALFVYGYFIWPRISSSIEALNLLELGNWLSFLGLVLAVLGLVIVLFKEKNEGLLFFMITTLIFAVFFIYDKRMNTRYPFSLRRYMPVLIPAYCLCIAYLRRFGRFVSLGLIPFVIIIPLYRCRDIIKVKDHHGWLKFWADFAEHLDNNAVYISNSYKWARPLSDIFSKKVITKRTPKSGEYYISDLSQPYAMDVDFIEVYRESYKGEYLEHGMTFPPEKKKQELDLKIYKIGEVGESGNDEYMIDIGEEGIGLLSGFSEAKRFSGIEGTARWTFNEARLVIPLPCNSLTIMAGGMPKEAGESIISLYIDDKLVVENYKIGEQMREHIFKITDLSSAKRGVLKIKSTTWSPRKYGIIGYPDNLGILLDWVEVER